MKWSGTNILAAVISVGFLFAFVTALVKSGGATTGTGSKMLLNEVKTVDAALAQAKSEGKSVMIDFNASWCGPCKRMQREAFTNEGVAELLKDTLFVSIDVDHPGENRKFISDYQFSGLPTAVFVDADGKEIGRTVGYGGVASFKSEIRRILAPH